MAQQRQEDGRRQRDYVIALTRLFIEALNARDLWCAPPSRSSTTMTASRVSQSRSGSCFVEVFRTAVFRVRDGAITSYETLGND